MGWLTVGEGPHSEAVRTVFAWSYRDLPPEAARMFRLLGLHRGPDISLAAAAFHREAARMHHRLGDSWQEALATIHLADCEQALDQTDASREHLGTALTLVQHFSDDRAVQLSARLRTRLS